MKPDEKINHAIQKIEIEDFGIKDRNKLNFWISMVEKYDYNRIISICLRAGTTHEVAERIASEIDNGLNDEDKETISMSAVRKIIFALIYHCQNYQIQSLIHQALLLILFLLIL